MSTHRNIDKICCVVLALALIVTALFACGEKFGLEKKTVSLGYETALFDTEKVHSVDIVIDDWDAFLETCQSEEYSVCNVVIDGEAFKNVAIRGKGNTSLTQVASYGNNRYSFKIEFDHYDSTKTYYGLDKLCLNNIIQDNTYMKDYLCYRLMAEMGAVAPLCSYVYITVNGEDWGLYLAVEGVEDGFLSRNFDGTGELYKPDSMDMGGGRGNGAKFDMDEFSESFADGLNPFESDKSDGTTQNDGNEVSDSTVPEMPQNGSQDGDMPSMPQGGMQSGDVPEMPQNGSQDGDMPSMPQDGMQSGDAPEMPQNGSQDGNMPSMPQGDMQSGDAPEMPQNGSQNGSQDGDMPSMPQGDMQSGDVPEMPQNGSQDGNMPEMPQGGMQSGNAPEMPGESFGGSMSGNDVLLNYIDDDADSYPNIFDNAKTDITNEDKSRLIEALKKLGEGTEIDSTVDIEEVINYFTVHNFVLNFDSYTGSMGHNYYLYEESGKLQMIAWDYNLAFGGFQSSQSATELANYPIDSPVSGGTVDSRPMLSWIFENEEYTELYHSRFSYFIEEYFDSGYFENLIDETVEMISPYIEKDPTKFCTFEEFEKGAATLKEFCLIRAESVKKQLSGEIGSTSDTQDSETFADAGDIQISDMGSMNNGSASFKDFGGATNPFEKDNSESADTDGDTDKSADTDTDGDTDTGADGDMSSDTDMGADAETNNGTSVPTPPNMGDKTQDGKFEAADKNPFDSQPSFGGNFSNSLIAIAVSLAVLAAGIIFAILFKRRKD